MCIYRLIIVFVYFHLIQKYYNGFVMMKMMNWVGNEEDMYAYKHNLHVRICINEAIYAMQILDL